MRARCPPAHCKGKLSPLAAQLPAGSFVTSVASGPPGDLNTLEIWPLAEQKRNDSPDFVLVEKMKCVLENGRKDLMHFKQGRK